MYDGYRLKIEGLILANKYIVIDAFSISSTRQINEDYDDEFGERHVNESGHTRTIIEFNLCERNAQDNQYLMGLFYKRSHVRVEYYDDRSGEYRAGDFRMDDFKLEQKYINNKEIWYKETAIRYEEY